MKIISSKVKLCYWHRCYHLLLKSTLVHLDVCWFWSIYGCRFMYFYTKRLLLLWKSTVSIVRKSFSAFMRISEYYVIPTISLVVSIYGMQFIRTPPKVLPDFVIWNFLFLSIETDFAAADNHFWLPIGPTMKNLSLVITRFVLLGD